MDFEYATFLCCFEHNIKSLTIRVRRVRACAYFYWRTRDFRPAYTLTSTLIFAYYFLKFSIFFTKLW